MVRKILAGSDHKGPGAGVSPTHLTDLEHLEKESTAQNELATKLDSRPRSIVNTALLAASTVGRG